MKKRLDWTWIKVRLQRGVAMLTNQKQQKCKVQYKGLDLLIYVFIFRFDYSHSVRLI